MKGLWFVILSISSLATQASIITVKQDGTGNYTSIQQAYNNAASGDTILVYPGTYFENLDITNPNKDITLCSLYLLEQDEYYIYNTIIDGNHNGSCIAIRNTHDAEVNIIGFTIEHGSGYNNESGGGIYIKYANPDIRNCIIQYNTGSSGAGLFLMFTSTTLAGNTIRYNHSYMGGGGINCAYEAELYFDENVLNNIYQNYATFAADIAKTNYSPPLEVIVDTFTVFNPDYYYMMSIDEFTHPLDDIYLSMLNNKIELVDTDLYINPIDGNNANDGLSFSTPLKTISYALNIINSDSLNPHSIHLSNGVYAPSTNGEYFMLGAKSFITIEGESKDSTILSADTISALLTSYSGLKNFKLNNVTLQNGFGHYFWAGIYLNLNENIHINNVILKNCKYSSFPGIVLGNNKKTRITNFVLTDIFGGSGFNVFNTEGGVNSILLQNCIINNCNPVNDPETNYGRGIQLSGFDYEPFSLQAKIINLQLTKNRFYNEEMWGMSGASSGLGIGHNTDLTLVNATINGNVTENDVAGAAVVVAGDSKLDIYNSIFYGDSIYELSLGTSTPTNYNTIANVSYSNLEGGQAEVQNWYNLYTLNWLEGNMDSDPLWDTMATNPYKLQWNSPCNDAGVPMYEPGMDFPYIKIEAGKTVLYKIDGDTLHLPPTDLAGNPRIVNGRIDMGAYEYQDTATRIKKLYLNNIQQIKFQVYPNPFTEHTFISFKLEQKASVRVIISDMAGRQIKQLVKAMMPTGNYTLTWEGDDDNGNKVNSGTFLISVYLDDQPVGSEKVVKKP